MARLARPVMKMRSVMPAATASSTAYWMSGLSTTGSISLGEALVAGRKRVPRPATGNTALVTLVWVVIGAVSLFLEQLHESGLVEHGDAELPGTVQLGAGFLAGDHEVGLLRDRSRHLAPGRLDAFLGLVAAHGLERA